MLVEGLARQQRLDQRVERLPVLAEQAPRLVVALADDPQHLGVDDARGLLAEGPLARRSPAPPARYGFWRGASCTMPSASLMPQRVTMLRASWVACSMSLSAPVVRVP